MKCPICEGAAPHSWRPLLQERCIRAVVAMWGRAARMAAIRREWRAEVALATALLPPTLWWWEIQGTGGGGPAPTEWIPSVLVKRGPPVAMSAA